MFPTFSRTTLILSNINSTLSDWFTMVMSPIFLTKPPGITGSQAAAKATIAKNMHATCAIFTCKRNNNLCSIHSAFRQHTYKTQLLMRLNLRKLMAKFVLYDFVISFCRHGFRCLMQCYLFLSVHIMFLFLLCLFVFQCYLFLHYL